MADGRHFEKWKKGYIFLMVQVVDMKFGKLMHIGPPSMSSN